MWLNMNCLCAKYIDRNQQAFSAQMTSFVVRYDVIYHSFPITSKYLMTWGVNSPVHDIRRIVKVASRSTRRLNY